MAATHERPGDRGSRDEVLRIGPDHQLTGIVSVAATGQNARTGVIILNAGVLHRIGPHRIHVQLARALAARGFTTLRLDVGGVGDSVASSDAPTFRESAVADTRLAMSRMSELHGLDRFVVFGICSGADNALATALVDDRVAGIIAVDPPLYISWQARVRSLRAKLARQTSIVSAARWSLGVVRRQLTARLRRRAVVEPDSGGRETPELATYRAQLVRLVDRGVRVFSLYSNAHRGLYNHADQLFEVMPELRGRVDHRWFPTANHTFTELDAQAQLLDATTQWIPAQFGPRS